MEWRHQAPTQPSRAYSSTVHWPMAIIYIYPWMSSWCPVRRSAVAGGGGDGGGGGADHFTHVLSRVPTPPTPTLKSRFHWSTSVAALAECRTAVVVSSYRDEESPRRLDRLPGRAGKSRFSGPDQIRPWASGSPLPPMLNVSVRSRGAGVWL